MQPNLSLLFQREKKRHAGAYLSMDIGLLYRARVREYLEEGVVADDLFYVEDKDWGLSHFYVTGPYHTLNHYRMRIRHYIDSEKANAERQAAARAELEALQAKRQSQSQSWWRSLFGLSIDR